MLRTKFALLALTASLPVFISSLSSIANAESPAVHANKSSDDKSKSAGASGLELSGGSGIGVFQDIQVPANQAANVRADGTVIDQENADHAGIPIFAGMAYVYRPTGELGWQWHVINVDALQMRASTGPAATQSSSYSRMNLNTAVSYGFALGSYVADVGINAGMRRSSFNNVSDAHYINAVLTGGRLALHSSSLALELFGAAAPMATFGYSDAGFFGGQQLKDSTASLSEAGGQVAFRLTPNVWLETGLEREMARVTIANISAYNTLGLNVQDPMNAARDYNLATTLARIGFRKDF